MNAHDTNALSRTILGIARATTEKPAPEFSRKLSYDEQRKLTDAQWGRYIDWLFAFNAPATKRWHERETLQHRELDRPNALATGETWEVDKRETGS